jgi:hypothetical protein
MEERHSHERLVVAHTASSAAEAMVIRSLLESAGIPSPNPVATDPFPLNEPLAGDLAIDIFVPESKAKEARRVIAEHLEASAQDSASTSEFEE